MVHSRDALIPGGDLSALIARLEAAEAGSRELDAAVWAASNGYELFEHDGAGWRYRMRPDDIMRHERTSYISPYTTSLDAALALAERVLPGGNWCVARDAGASETARFRAWVQSEEDRQANPLGLSSDAAPTAPLALCISILRGIQHRYEGEAAVSPNLNPKAQGEVG